MERIASVTRVPCATSTSTWRSLETISSGVCLFLRIVILLRLASHTSGWTTPTGADHNDRFGLALHPTNDVVELLKLRLRLIAGAVEMNADQVTRKEITTRLKKLKAHVSGAIELLTPV